MKYIYSILVIMLILAAVGVAGCVDKTPLDNPEETICPVQDYGNGVLFFGCTDIMFVKTLSDYIGKNNITVYSMTPVMKQLTYNSEKGYIVVVKK
jgi:predicted small lipoprotein YifL